MAAGEGFGAECAVVHPSAPGFEKSRSGGLHTSFSRAKSVGPGERGSEGFKPSALYPGHFAAARGSASGAGKPIRQEENGFFAESTTWRRIREIDKMAPFLVPQN